MRLAIVGSRSLEGTQEVRNFVRWLLIRDRPSLVVSGGAEGADTIAEQEAIKLDIPTDIHLAPAGAKVWADFKGRDLAIALSCDKLIRLVSERSKSYGSGWTRDRARERGVPVEEYRFP